MGFVEAVKSVYSNYVNFQGRARRSEYWWWFLFYLVVVLVLAGGVSAISETLGGALYVLFVLGSILPAIAVQVRRLHDTGRSGWWLLLALIPVVGFIVLLIFYISDSEAGSNKYGPNPKGA